MVQKLELGCHKQPRNAKRDWKPEEARKNSSLAGTLIWFQTSSLQICEYKLLLFKDTNFVVICYCHPQTLIYKANGITEEANRGSLLSNFME